VLAPALAPRADFGDDRADHAVTAGPGRWPTPYGEGSDGLGYPVAGPPPAWPPPPRWAAPGPVQQPGPATAAAVLGFVAAAVLWLAACWLVVGFASFGPLTSGTDVAVVLGLAIGSTTVSAMLAAGSHQVLSRQGRHLLVRASRVELGVLGVVTTAAFVFLDSYLAASYAPFLLAGIAVAVVRLVLLFRPVVSAWATVVAGPADDGPLRAVLVPHVALYAATLIMWLLYG
jgi:hypothetical protein